MNRKTWIACGDVHGDLQDKRSVEAFLAHTDDLKPDELYVVGDLFDFRNLRRGASSDEKADSMYEDLNAGLTFAYNFFNRPATKKVLQYGNHCVRAFDCAKSWEGVKRDYALSLIREIETELRKLGVTIVPYTKREFIKVGKTGRLIHGIGATMHQAKQVGEMYAPENGWAAQFHTHRPDYYRVRALKPREGYVSGCLCQLDMDYNRTHAAGLSQEHGWLFGSYKGSDYNVQSVIERNGKFLVATEFKEY